MVTPLPGADRPPIPGLPDKRNRVPHPEPLGDSPDLRKRLHEPDAILQHKLAKLLVDADLEEVKMRWWCPERIEGGEVLWALRFSGLSALVGSAWVETVGKMHWASGEALGLGIWTLLMFLMQFALARRILKSVTPTVTIRPELSTYWSPKLGGKFYRLVADNQRDREVFLPRLTHPRFRKLIQEKAEGAEAARKKERQKEAERAEAILDRSRKAADKRDQQKVKAYRDAVAAIGELDPELGNMYPNVDRGGLSLVNQGGELALAEGGELAVIPPKVKA